MNIGFFSDGYAPQLNGVATNVDAVACALEQQGHCVSIVAPQMGEYVDRRRRVYRLPSFLAVKDPALWCTLPPSPRTLDHLASLPLDIVHIHTPFGLGLVGWEISRRKGIPLVSTYHTLLPAHVHHARLLGFQPVSPRWAERYSAWTCDVCNHVIAPSEKIQRELSRIGVHKPVHLIRNGVDLDRFGHGSPGFLRRQFGLSETCKILLSVGRLTEDKNFAFLIDVLARVVAESTDTYLVLVGQGPLGAQLQDRAGELGARHNLILTGPIQPCEMPQVYADADLFVNASHSETFSLVTLEAIVAGLPVVLAQDEALQVMVCNGVNGRLVASDPGVFAGAVLSILHDHELARRMSLASRERGRLFSIQTQAKQLVELYRVAIAEKEMAYSDVSCYNTVRS